MLRLQVLEEAGAGGAQEVTLALDFQPADGGALPAIADLRFAIAGPAEVLSVGVGQAVHDAGKELFVDPHTGQPFRVLPATGEAGSVVQLLVFSTGPSEPIPAGRLAVLRVAIDEAAAGDPPLGSVPVTVRLIEREETFAPPPADATLWGGGYGEPVVVWPEVDDE